MSELWVAVTAEYDGTVFSHRATSSYTVGKHEALRPFGRLLDESATCVRSGLAGWLPPQWNGAPNAPLSEHEKIAEIRRMVIDDIDSFPGYVDTLEKIREVLER